MWDAHRDDDLTVSMRNSVVMSFLFTYELASTLLRRFLQATMTTRGDAGEMTFPTLIRVGSEYGMLLHDWVQWFEYRKARNVMSHTYGEERANDVVAIAPRFLEDAEFLYKRLMEETQ